MDQKEPENNGIKLLIKRLSASRIGFKMDEVMSGTHRFEPGYGPQEDLPMEFRVTWG